MSKTFDEIAGAVYRACNPLIPAHPNVYVDCAKARGQQQFAKQVLSHLDFAGEPRCFLFAGHIGCGKSSELRDLAQQLKQSTQSPTRYVPILIPSLTYIDIFDAQPEDVLLMLASQMAESLRADYKVDLADGYAASRWNQLVDLLLTPVELEGGQISASVLSAKLKLNRSDSEAKKKARDALRPRHADLHGIISECITAAETALNREFGARAKLVLIIDDLEKVQSFENKHGSLESQRQLFIERSALLTGLPATVIYSVSLDLARGQATRLQAAYGTPPFILPMVKVFHRGKPESPDDSGYDCIGAILHNRITEALGASPSDIFSLDAIKTLIRYTGGNVRQFLQAARQSLTFADKKLPVLEAAAQRAIGQLKATYDTTIAEPDWDKLAKLDASPSCKIANHDDTYLRLLEQIAILEYLNGGNTDDQSPWYAVHPAVRELDRFKLAQKG